METICTAEHLGCCPNLATTHRYKNAEVRGHAPSHRCPIQLPEKLGKLKAKHHAVEHLDGASLTRNCYLIPNKTLSKSELYRGPFASFRNLNYITAI